MAHDIKIPGTLYYSLLGICIAIFLGFTYLSFFSYNITRGTKYFFLSYLIIAPVFVSGFLLFLLLAVGKNGFYEELRQLRSQ